MKLHDIIMTGPFGQVRMNNCSDQEIKKWIAYGIERGATAMETILSEAA